MLADSVVDQAHGLRRMFQGKRLRVIHVVAGRGGVGRTSVAINLGLALARRGRETLLIECVPARGDAHALRDLGLDARLPSDLPHGGALAVPGPHGLAIVPLVLPAKGARVQSELAALDVASFVPGNADTLDYVLVTSSPALSAAMLLTDHDRCDVVVVLSRAPSSITEGYALIKRMSARGDQRRFYVLANRVASDHEALLIYQNMSQVARGYLDVRLELMGYIPADAAIERAAAQGRSLFDLKPATPASTRYRQLADDIAGWELERAGTIPFEVATETPAGVN